MDAPPESAADTPAQTPAAAPVPRQSNPLKRPTRITLIVLTVIYLILLVPAGLFAFISSFEFEAGATPDPLVVYLLFISLPFVLLLGTILAWLLYRFKIYRAALVVGFLPMLEILLLALPIIIFS